MHEHTWKYGITKTKLIRWCSSCDMVMIKNIVRHNENDWMIVEDNISEEYLIKNLDTIKDNIDNITLIRQLYSKETWERVMSIKKSYLNYGDCLQTYNEIEPMASAMGNLEDSFSRLTSALQTFQQEIQNLRNNG